MASPTIGQQRVLQLLCRVTYVLRATRSSGLTVVYAVTERGSGHLIQTLTEPMVRSLVDAGWIERESGQSQATWTYQVTPAGVVAANAPRGG